MVEYKTAKICIKRLKKVGENEVCDKYEYGNELRKLIKIFDLELSEIYLPGNSPDIQWDN